MGQRLQIICPMYILKYDTIYKTEVINNMSCVYNDTKVIKSEITDVMKLQNRL